MDYTYIKTLLQDNLNGEVKDDLAPERDAIITHWLHSQNSKSPLVDDRLSYAMERIIKEENNLKVSNVCEPDDLQFSLDLDYDVPFPSPIDSQFKFIDLFAGIGGFRLAMQELNGRCVFSSEWDSKAKITYERNYGEVPFGDIKKIPESEIPDHDVLCAGFPCQPFSLAGVSARNHLDISHGFNCEIQGTLFYDIARIIRVKRPRVVFLENVRNIENHDNGKTFEIIRETFKELKYSFKHIIIDSSPLVPQKRVRCYMVAIRDNAEEFEFPKVKGEPLPLKSILEEEVSEKYTISDKLWKGHQRRTKRNLERGVGFTAHLADIDKPSNTIVARYGKDGKECLIPQDGQNPRMLTPRECARLQGFPEKFIIPVAKTHAYRQFGNSVAVPVIRKISEKIVALLKRMENEI